MADRIGGLRTVMVGSAFQAVAIACFLLTQDEVGLFVIAAAFGLGFSGIIPSYSVAIRDLFPASEASWRIPSGPLHGHERHGLRQLVCRRPL